MPRFALLFHNHPLPHFDLLLEAGPHAWTWRLASLPVPDTEVAAERIADHRLLYLDYEGAISGGRGTVTRQDSGSFTWVLNTPSHIIVALQGQRFQGQLALNQRGSEWFVRFTASEPV